jgi:hypothetical protein
MERLIEHARMMLANAEMMITPDRDARVEHCRKILARLIEGS